MDIINILVVDSGMLQPESIDTIAAISIVI